MKTYKLIEIHEGSENIAIYATERQVIHLLHLDLKRILQQEIPKSTVEQGHYLNGEGRYWLELHNLKIRNQTFTNALVGRVQRWLCEHGWEPFAVEHGRVFFGRKLMDNNESFWT